MINGLANCLDGLVSEQIMAQVQDFKGLTGQDFLAKVDTAPIFHFVCLQDEDSQLEIRFEE